MANIFKAKTLLGRTGIFSHEVIAPNLVYNTGNQTILGNKTFVDNIEVQGTGIFNSVDLSNISEFQFSGVTMNLVDTNVYVSGGWIYISGNPVLTGSLSLSTLNLNNVVYTTGNQTILGIKDFDQINVSGIKFDLLTTTQTPPHQEGMLYYSDDNKTLNLDLDVADLKLLVGQENIIRAKNLTNTTMSPGTVVYINSAQGNTPLVQRSIATGDSTSARTLGVAAHSINNNSKGYFTTFGLVEGIDTSAYSIGQTLYLSHEVSGGLTGVKPQAPNHIVRIGNVIDQGANGSIFVDILNGFELDELHDVRIINQQNKDGLVYNSASGLWLNTPVALANEVNGVVYITGNQIISGVKTFANNQIFSGNINVSGTGLFAALDITNIDGISLSGVDISIVNGTVTSNYPINASTVNAINLVYNSGSQIISGTKTFTLRPNVNGSGVLLVGEAAGLPPNILFTSGQQLISGSKSFSNTVSFSGVTTFSNNTIFSGTVIDIIDTALNLSGAGDMTFTSTNINFINSPVFISGTNLRVSGDIFANNLYTTGNIGIGTSAPSEKLEVNGNIKFGDILNGYSAKFLMYDSPNGVYNTGEWSDGQLILSAGGYATNKSIILNFQGDTNAIESNGSILRLPSGKDDFIAMDVEVVHKTGNEIINGNKTFPQTGEFQAIKLNKNRFLSYDYETSNFNFLDYITIVNSTLSGSSDFVTGILPIGNPAGNISGFNFLLKNINTCPVLITGSGNYTIDGESNLYVYKGESVELLGVQAVGITGWYTLNTNLGVV